jgi:hypothetical protein
LEILKFSHAYPTWLKFETLIVIDWCLLAESEGRSGTLDTLPEEKSTNTQYKRVYSDWRPTIEKTDIVGAMEAIEGGCCCTSHCSGVSGGETGQTVTDVRLDWKHVNRDHNENDQMHT